MDTDHRFFALYESICLSTALFASFTCAHTLRRKQNHDRCDGLSGNMLLLDRYLRLGLSHAVLAYLVLEDAAQNCYRAGIG